MPPAPSPNVARVFGRARGLKPASDGLASRRPCRARLRARAWIETCSGCPFAHTSEGRARLRARAWIETLCLNQNAAADGVARVFGRARGLKHAGAAPGDRRERRAPRRGGPRGRETVTGGHASRD